MTKTLTRRDFIKVLSIGSAGLVLASYLPSSGFKSEYDITVDDVEFSPDVFLSIHKDNILEIMFFRCELGQGAKTTVPMIIADELDADWNLIKITQVQAHQKKYGSMTTGGSTTVRMNFDRLRKCAAAAREMLITSASELWSIDTGNCFTESSFVINKINGFKKSYGELSVYASKLTVPENPVLKKDNDLKFISSDKPPKRTDSLEKLKGTAKFGIDFSIPGMLYAASVRSEVIGGKLKSYSDSETKKIIGVVDTVTIGDEIFIIAEDTYSAFKGKKKLKAEWDNGMNINLNSSGIFKMFEEKSKGDDYKVIKSEGDFDSAYASSEKKIESVYEIPFISHAQLEPVNCIADVSDGKAEIWISTQNPQRVQGAVADALKIPVDSVFVNVLYSGGGFGRRLMADYVSDTALLSKKMKKPVMLIWDREDDMTRDFYRPASYHKLFGGLTGSRLTSFKHYLVSPSVMEQLMPDSNRTYIDAADALVPADYIFPHSQFLYTMANTPVPVGWFRSVYHSQTPFVTESFIDELAHNAGVDPYTFRKNLLPEDSRIKKVLDKAVELIDFNKKRPGGRGVGIACNFSFGSYAAHAAEVEVINNKLKILKFVCVVDCGIAVSREILKQQLEGAVVFALSAALKGEITVEGGKIVQKNYDKYELLKMSETPETFVYIIESKEKPGGIGEPGVPTVAPALCNAIFAACGKRIKKLPLLKYSDLTL